MPYTSIVYDPRSLNSTRQEAWRDGYVLRTSRRGLRDLMMGLPRHEVEPPHFAGVISTPACNRYGTLCSSIPPPVGTYYFVCYHM